MFRNLCGPSASRRILRPLLATATLYVTVAASFIFAANDCQAEKPLLVVAEDVEGEALSSYGRQRFHTTPLRYRSVNSQQGRAVLDGNSRAKSRLWRRMPDLMIRDFRFSADRKASSIAGYRVSLGRRVDQKRYATWTPISESNKRLSLLVRGATAPTRTPSSRRNSR